MAVDVLNVQCNILNICSILRGYKSFLCTNFTLCAVFRTGTAESSLWNNFLMWRVCTDSDVHLLLHGILGHKPTNIYLMQIHSRQGEIISALLLKHEICKEWFWLDVFVCISDTNPFSMHLFFCVRGVSLL